MTTTQNKICLELTPSNVEQILWQLQIAANETGAISTADWFVDKCSKHGVVFYRDGNGTMRAKLPPSIKQRAVELITKIRHSLVVCNLREYNRNTRIPGYLIVLTRICVCPGLTGVNINEYLDKYNKVFTRLLKGKPSVDEWFKMVTRIDIEYDLDD